MSDMLCDNAAVVRQPTPLAWTEAESAIVPFLSIVAPELHAAENAIWQALRHQESANPGSLNIESLYRAGSGALRRAPMNWLSRAAVLELNLARAEGRLTADTRDARFHEFVSGFDEKNGRARFFETYPLLQRAVFARVRQTAAALTEIFERSATDRIALARSFAGTRDKGPLVDLTMDQGDRHCDGRSVAILRYGDGSRVVYKPRPLAVEQAYFDFVERLNQEGLVPDQARVSILDRGPYGYMSFVATTAVDSTAAVERYYTRYGGLVALMHLFCATDMHYENIIAWGEYPCPIDLETLLHPLVRSSEAGRQQRGAIADTVLRTSMLPAGSGGGVKPVRELSGLAPSPDTAAVRYPVNAGTDGLRFEQRSVPFAQRSNLPILQEKPVPAVDYGAEIVAGFNRTYEHLRCIKTSLMDESGMLAPFKALESRVLLRGTQIYVSLLNAAAHPDFQRGDGKMAQLLERLSFDAAQPPGMAACNVVERNALSRGDVPRFSAATDATIIRDCFGQPIANIFQRSGYREVLRRARALSARDQRRQARLIGQSVGCLRPSSDRHLWATTPYGGLAESFPVRSNASPRAADGIDSAAPIGAVDLVGDACRVADALLEQAFRDHRDIVYFQMDSSKGTSSIAALDWPLYDGLSGIALFFAALGHATGERRYRNAARRLIETARRSLRHSADSVESVGAYSGLAGWLYTLGYLGLLWRDEDLLREARSWLPTIQDRVRHDRALDLIGGAAGALWVMARLHAQLGGDDLLAAANACAAHLVDRASPAGEGIGWLTSNYAEAPLTGFSHGCGGIAAALALLDRATGERHHARYVEGALAYERGTFSPQLGAWADVRDDRRDAAGRQTCNYAWCHGAPGIGLARLCLPSAYRGDAWHADIEASLAATLTHGFGASHCLCHGDLGNIELLIEVERQRLHPQGGSEKLWRPLSVQIAERVRAQPRGGGHREAELPGLMTGLAGIGYGLLRCALPDSVPSVLTLQLPRR